MALNHTEQLAQSHAAIGELLALIDEKDAEIARLSLEVVRLSEHGGDTVVIHQACDGTGCTICSPTDVMSPEEYARRNLSPPSFAEQLKQAATMAARDHVLRANRLLP